MKRIQTLLLFVVVLSVMASAQTQLENAGFELWEDILVSDVDTIREPVEWSSLKTSDDPTLSNLAPVVCTRSRDAHTGDFSIKLTNVKSFIIANGVATNGRMHPVLNTALAYMFTDTVNDQWNTPFTGRPDSIAGWMKYTTPAVDIMQVKVTLHQGFGRQPDPDSTENWIGVADYRSSLHTEGEWVRFSSPFNYSSEAIPEYVLLVLNSGNGYQPVAGSVLLLDDLEMIYNTPQSSANRLQQTEGYIFAVDKRQLILKGMDPSLFQNIKIFDISGKLLWSSRLTGDQVDIEPAHLGNGLYLLRLSGKDAIFTQKIVLR